MSSSPLYYNHSRDRFKKRKARFTFSEVHILLDEVRKHRKFNRGVPTDAKKRTWAEITARVNEIGECQREIIEVIKKWSDLKCDTKRKIAAMQTGTVPNRGLNSRMSKDLNPTRKLWLKFWRWQTMMMAVDEEEMEEEDMIGFQSSPNGGLESSMPPPSSYFSSGSAQPDLPFELPEDTEGGFAESEDEQKDEPPLPNLRSRRSQDHQENNGLRKQRKLNGQRVTESREQHATNMLLETVSRSLELLAESVQQLAETQQEFVRESLQLQRETVQVLRDFTGGAIALIHDKLNGRPAL
ncbi:hypothetical protein WMY93_016877 [Mugilogobius chulae]|uniref:Myb/SANT-like DNA-binding domain-containing protein n=1 Tax=Mugilogobius chulae TaxID=88201 RepID=A0AAW0NWS4_9GOBI